MSHVLDNTLNWKQTKIRPKERLYLKLDDVAYLIWSFDNVNLLNYQR